MTKDPDGQETDSVEVADARSPALTLDYDLYVRYLDDTNLSDAQKKEFIETLWSVIVSFVDLGFGLHPLQQSCESNVAIPDLPAAESGDVVDSIHSLPKTSSIEAVPHSLNGRGMREES